MFLAISGALDQASKLTRASSLETNGIIVVHSVLIDINSPTLSYSKHCFIVSSMEK